MRIIFMALLAGILFGLGLTISEMVNPARVIGFLNITGDWDPTLALVMGGALMVTFPLFPYILKRPQPIFADKFSLPDKVHLDKRLFIGSILFGLGWGLAGFCPGPAITALVTLSPDVVIFVMAMLVGFWLENLLERHVI
ncbi:MAG: YeeE/YedE family protein [Gammaproteobacteria bacterium]|nr:YeeE/YedE family protein [Gammaproteobacteria bacterium]